MKSHELLADLKKQNDDVIAFVYSLENLSDEALNYKVSSETWSLLENLEHLNLYGDFYIPEITRRLEAASESPEEETFKSGLLGNYFAKSMLPREPLNKMKTFKDKNPNGSQLDRKTIERFLDQQKIYFELMERAKSVNLNKVKTAISISSFIKLKLGDIFRVLIYHHYRHQVQMEAVLKVLPKQSIR